MVMVIWETRQNGQNRIQDPDLNVYEIKW